jgi:hypothetical protein
MDIDSRDVSAAGWAVVFPGDTADAVREALRPLLSHRERQVRPDRFKVLEHRGESRHDWLNKHGATSSDVDPERVPYYVLLIGPPTAIPFEFQYLLDVEYAVGRLSFDRPEEYRHYAESIVAYETASAPPNAREVVFWATRHDRRDATWASADQLVTPLYEGLSADGNRPELKPIAQVLSYRTRLLKGNDATKGNLVDLLHARGAGASPAVLFTASHGVGWPRNHPLQRPAQGALLGQDWPGPGSINPRQFLAAADVSDEARVHGLVAFLYASYAAGTPGPDPGNDKPPLMYVTTFEGRPFVAALPQRLLSHPAGGALAVLGLVGVAWDYSHSPGTDARPALLPYRNCLGRVLDGQPVGHATKDFNERFAELSAELLDRLYPGRSGPPPDDAELVRLWIERNDAEHVILLGDPAACVRAAPRDT